MSGIASSGRFLVRARPRWCGRASSTSCGHLKQNPRLYVTTADHGAAARRSSDEVIVKGRPSFLDHQVLYMDNQSKSQRISLKLGELVAANPEEKGGMTSRENLIPCEHRGKKMLWINKPAGLLSQADRTGDVDVLALGREYVRVAANKPGEAFVAMVHRLDRPVSGVMCIARTSKAAARLAASFQERDNVEKIYHAVVVGELSGSGTREDILAPSQASSGGGQNTAMGGRGPRTTIIRKGVGAGAAGNEEGNGEAAGAQRAVLKWKAIYSLNSSCSMLCRPIDGGADRPHTLVRVKLITGRKHQIRAQLAGMGHPVVGDVRYGGRSSWSSYHQKGGKHRARDRVTVMDNHYKGIVEDDGLSPLRDRSILLHATELAVPHPTRPGETVRMQAPPPDLWMELCGREILLPMFRRARRRYYFSEKQ